MKGRLLYKWGILLLFLKKVDTLFVKYTMPDTSSNTLVKVDIEFLNQNTLSLVRSIFLKVQ